MKNTASNPSNTTQRQTKESRPNTGPGAANANRDATNAASSSQRETERAKRGEPLPANKASDRSPKQENL